MNAHARQGARIDTGCATVFLVCLLIGCAIYLIAYGEPQGIPLSLVVVVLLWPFALIWWSLYWIALVIVVALMVISLKQI